MLEVHELTKKYQTGEEFWALKGVSLAVQEGEFVAIMGASGSGKSTFMNMIGCLDKATSGTFTLDGVKVTKLADKEISVFRNQKIGFIFQAYHLLPRISVLRNVELPMLYAGVKRKERIERAKVALEKVGLGDKLDRKPTQLSGGQKQRVAIARALINQPKIILADEPTGNLDSKTTLEIINIFQQLHAQGATILMVTHEPEIAQYAERIVVFKDGLIIQDVQVENRLFASSESEVSA